MVVFADANRVNNMRGRPLRQLAVAAILLGVSAGCVHYAAKPLAPDQALIGLEARSLADDGLQKFIATNAPDTAQEWPRRSWDLRLLTLAAFYFHPSLDIARAQWAVARGGESIAGARPNPVLSVVPGYSANPAKGVSPWFPSVTLDVPLETAGKRGHRIMHAQQMSEISRLNISIAALAVRSGVRVALVDYATARTRAELLARNVLLQQRVTELLEQRFAAGAVSAIEVSPARIALVKLRAEIADARRREAEARARISESLGLPARALDGVELTFDLSQTADTAWLSTEARRQALLGRADILALLAEYAASESALQLEIAKQYPDLHFSPGYQYDQGENKWSLGLSVELPVLYRNQGGIVEARARRDQTAARFLAQQAKVISEIDRALLNRTAAIEQLRQVDELVSAERQQIDQLETSFKAGAADQFDLASARVEFATTELARLDALAKQQQAIGLLEDALQRPFDGLSTVERDPRVQSTKDK
jgi:outer membrane protein TolC